jgi:hypothetical protein
MQQATSGTSRGRREMREEVERRVKKLIREGKVPKQNSEARRLHQENLKFCNRSFYPEITIKRKKVPDFEKYLKKQPARCLANEKFAGNPTEDMAYSLFLLQGYRVARNKKGKYFLFEKKH